MEFLVLFFLILLNGGFAMAELALVIANSSRLERLAAEGDGGARIALHLKADPTRFLSTIQIGITAIGILNGIVGSAALAEPLSLWLQGLGMERYSAPLATFLVVAIVTYLTIVIGELVPKRIGQFRPEGVARAVARPIAFLATVSHPFVKLLSFSTDNLLRLVGKGELSSSNLTEEDIHAVLEEGSAAGVIEEEEHQMVRKVFRLDDRQIGSLMTPRSEITFLDVNESTENLLRQVAESDHSRFPVCDGNPEKLLGIITAKRLIQTQINGLETNLRERLQPAVFVPESLTGMQLLEQFRRSGMPMLFVTDEYGDLQGLVTVQDILEALAGEFRSPNPEDVWAVQRQDGSWLLDGLMPLPELKDHLQLKAVPEEDKGRYHTASGLVMWLLDRLPRTGDIVQWEGWGLEVVDMDGNRVDKILASRLHQDNDGSAT